MSTVPNCLALQVSTSLPGSPFNLQRGNQFNWCRPCPPNVPNLSRRPLVLPCLENLDLPYADDSAAITPISEELCNVQNAQNFQTFRQRLNSTIGGNRIAQLETRYSSTGGGVGGGGGPTRKSSYAPHQTRYSSHALEFPKFRRQERKCEPTHFHWATSIRHKVPQQPADRLINRNKMEVGELHSK